MLANFFITKMHCLSTLRSRYGCGGWCLSLWSPKSSGVAKPLWQRCQWPKYTLDIPNSISYILWFKQAFCHSSFAYSISVQLSFMKTNNINYDNEFSALHYARSNAHHVKMISRHVTWCCSWWVVKYFSLWKVSMNIYSTVHQFKNLWSMTECCWEKRKDP